MRFSAPARCSALPRGWRWLLVLLTLVASLMHLTRSPAVGGLGLSGPLAQALMPPKTQVQAAADLSPMTDDMPMDGPMDVRPLVRPAARSAPAASAPDLMGAAPNAPPHATAHSAAHTGHRSGDHPGDHAAAHCPFCLSAGFALESAPTVLAFGPLSASHTEAARFHGPALSSVRHADPRAPPRLG